MGSQEQIAIYFRNINKDYNCYKGNSFFGF